MATNYDIAVVISDLGSGGAQRVVTQLAAGWLQRGRRVAVITLADDADDFFRLPAGVTRIVIGGVGESRSRVRGLLANLSRMVRLRTALGKAGAPVALAFMTQTAILTVLANAGLGARVVVCERNDPDRQSFGLIWDMLRRLVYPLATKVTANSHGALAALRRRGLPLHKLAHVPNPLTPPSPGRALKLPAPTVVTIGRLHHQKAHDVLLRAFAKFRSTHPAWRLAIVGEGGEGPNLRALATRLKIDDAVDWHGRCADPYPLLCAAQIFALPSRYEGMPNALLEAMACGLPCVVSDASPGPLELVENEVSGLVVRVDDPEALASALARLADDCVLARRLGQAARCRVAAHELPAALAAWEQALELTAPSSAKAELAPHHSHG